MAANKPKKQKKGRYNFLMDSSTYEEFSKICEEEGFVRGKKVEHLIKKFVEGYNEK